MRKILMGVLAAVLSLTGTSAVAEYLYPLANPGFESPTLDSTNSWYSGVNGWGTAGSPVGTTYDIPWAEPNPTTEGSQYLFGDTDDFHIFQQVGTVQANTRYALYVDLYPLSSGTTRATVIAEETDTWSTILGELQYQPTWDPGRQDFTLPSGQWTTVALGINTAEFPQAVGKNFRIRVQGYRLAIDNVRLVVADDVRTFYISSSQGDDLLNTGFSSSSPWASFSNLGAFLPLLPGEKVLLNRGDTWTDMLHLSGKGTASDRIQVSAYGTGDKPKIIRSDLQFDRCFTYEGASYVDIDNLDMRNAKIGLYLRYDNDAWNQSVTVTDCYFEDMPDPSLDPSMHNYELAWSDAIFLGGKAYGATEQATMLDGLTITNCTVVNAAHGFGTAWYYPATYFSRLKNLIMEDNLAINCLNGWMSLISVDTGHMKRCHSIGGGGQDTWSGTTLGMTQTVRDFLIEDNEFSFIDRAQAGDGSGMDFEGNTINVTFRNNTIHDCDASAILILSTEGPHQNLVITENTFYNNALDPWNDKINSEIQGSYANHTGSFITNNTFYRRDAEVEFISPNSDWSGFTISGNTYANYDDVRFRPTWWEFNTNGDFEGWGTFNHWGSPSVFNGVLSGSSTSIDPFVHSPQTFVNSTLTPYAWVRMKTTSGNWGQVFYITDTDPIWDGNKVATFALNSDGQFHDYFVDLDSPGHMGVVTQVRLDPTTVGGSNIEVDFVRLTDSTDPQQSPPPAPAPVPFDITLTSIAAEDGYALESGKDTFAGGSVDTSSSTFRVGDDSSNRAYRPVLSFDTSVLPDDAQVVQATLGITRVGNITGQIPIGVAYSPWGDILVDVSSPGFSGSSSLQSSDWQSAADKLGASKYAWPAYEDGMTINSRLEDVDLGLISVTNKTQFRIRYQFDDDADNVADYVSYATADHSNASYRPTLRIKYYSNAPQWQSLIYDDFENGWGNYIDGGSDCTLYTNGTHAHQGSNAANVQDNSGASSSFYSRDLDFHNPGYTEIQVDFWYKVVSFENVENFYVEFYDGSQWIIMADFIRGTHFNNDEFKQGSVLIQEQFVNFPTNGKIRFRSDASGNADDVYFDEINVQVR